MIDTEKIRWASSEEIEPSNGLKNKLEPPSEFKISGEKKGQPIPRQWLNYQFDQYYIMLGDLQEQIVSANTNPTLIGVSASRPILANNDADRGTQYFDTTLAPNGKPVWWSGTLWIDSAGSPV